MFLHGGIDEPGKEEEPVMGQQEIHKKIMQLNFRDCHAKIRQVDSHATLANGVVVQVILSCKNLVNDGVKQVRISSLQRISEIFLSESYSRSILRIFEAVSVLQCFSDYKMLFVV